VAVDGSGNIYVADLSYFIHKVTYSGVVSELPYFIGNTAIRVAVDSCIQPRLMAGIAALLKFRTLR
jgi:hypothetical protein